MPRRRPRSRAARIDARVSLLEIPVERLAADLDREVGAQRPSKFLGEVDLLCGVEFSLLLVIIKDARCSFQILGIGIQSGARLIQKFAQILCLCQKLKIAFHDNIIILLSCIL